MGSEVRVLDSQPLPLSRSSEMSGSGSRTGQSYVQSASESNAFAYTLFFLSSKASVSKLHNMSAGRMMRAVVLKAPYQVKVEQVPYPTLQEPGDVIIKVSQAGLCGEHLGTIAHVVFELIVERSNAFSGSDLHLYREEAASYDYILGHEVVGEIVEVGTGIKKFKVGDRVFAPFCTSCGKSMTLIY